MEEVIIPVALFFTAIGLPVLVHFGKYYLRHVERRLEISAGSGGHEARAQLEELQRENKALRVRVENLETIVTSVDLELNVRLNKVLSEVSQANLRGLPGGAADASTHVLRPGQLLGARYEIRGEIGRGGMGAVYRAWDPRLSEEVAIKVILPVYWDSDAARKRFVLEAGAARRVAHPNVLRVYDINVDGDLIYISMEYFAGQRLSDVMADRGPLPLPEILAVGTAMLDGLAAAHDAGVIHRDLKPQNILVGTSGQLKIIDFGLAAPPRGSGLTATGVVLGTPEYMSPEQLRGQRPDIGTDIYAAGVILYELATGKRPFSGEGPIAIALAHSRELPAPPSQHRPLPRDLEQVILRALEKEPENRHRSANAMCQALRAALG
ncbi:MAG: serine/threonine protein kinase [Candidatus Schekmanbacteria bacterium]|nr:serine/threonine protein kinase [Candidatus Schekmanbacteria bacterium]